MSQPSESIDGLLRNARLLDEEYRDYQPPTTQQRLARAAGRRAQHHQRPDTARPVAAESDLVPEHEHAHPQLDPAGAPRNLPTAVAWKPDVLDLVEVESQYWRELHHGYSAPRFIVPGLDDLLLPRW